MSLLPEKPLDFRVKANLGLALAAVFILTPFSVNNFVQGRPVLGLGSFAIVVVLGFRSWRMWRGLDAERLTLLVLVPSILLFLSLSIQNQGIVGIFWSYPALMAFYILLSERSAILANLLLLVVVAPQAWMVLDENLAWRAVATLLAVSVFAAIFIHAIAIAHGRLEKLATTDSLTGLLNRATLMDEIADAIEQNHRSAAPVTLFAFDIDHFKSINDSFGHARGDDVLVELAELLRTRFRRIDRIFRTGGEEFLIILSGTDEATGTMIGEELREKIASSQILRERPVTISGGIASLLPDDSADAWLQRADERMYEAKNTGRNRIVG